MSNEFEDYLINLQVKLKLLIAEFESLIDNEDINTLDESSKVRLNMVAFQASNLHNYLAHKYEKATENT